MGLIRMPPPLHPHPLWGKRYTRLSNQPYGRRLVSLSGAAAEPLLAQRCPQGGVPAAQPDELPLAVHPHNKVPDGCTGPWTNRAASLPRKG